MSSADQFLDLLNRWTEVSMRHSMRDWTQFVRSKSLNMPQFSTLMKLYYGGGCGISDISAHTETTVAAASQMVDRLVQLGLLERIEDPNDRRAKQVTISPKGRALVENGIEVRRQWHARLPETLTPEQLSRITAALQVLVEAASHIEEREHPGRAKPQTPSSVH